MRLVRGHEGHPERRAPIEIETDDEPARAMLGDQRGHHVGESAQRVHRAAVRAPELVGDGVIGAEPEAGAVEDQQGSTGALVSGHPLIVPRATDTVPVAVPTGFGGWRRLGAGNVGSYERAHGCQVRGEGLRSASGAGGRVDAGGASGRPADHSGPRPALPDRFGRGLLRAAHLPGDPGRRLDSRR